MAWTTPKTNWATGELVTAEDMNAIGENLALLKPTAIAAYTTTEDIAIPGDGTFRDVDSDNLNLSITTSGGDVLVHFHGRQIYSDRRFDVEVDGKRIGNSENGIWSSHGDDQFVCFTRLIQDLSAGSHVFKLQYSGALTGYSRALLAGAQFWVREI